MNIHRHVSATNESGVSYYQISEEVAPVEVAFQPGMKFYPLWGTDADGPDIGAANSPTFAPFFPVGHGTRALVVAFPPADDNAPSFVMGGEDAEALRQDAESKLPGLFSAHEADEDDPGYHTTQTLDYVFVLEGELHLEQDGGDEVVVRPGHLIVQRGTNHKWSNRAPAPAAMAVILIAAERR